MEYFGGSGPPGSHAAPGVAGTAGQPSGVGTAGTAAVGTLGDELIRLHRDPALLVMVNVWDAASARVVASLPGCTAIATASHSIAAAHGYPDGERIPLDDMLRSVSEIVGAVDLPVSADLESGYGNVDTTVRRAIGIGVVGANIEDGMHPLGESVDAVRSAVRAAEAEGVPFALNARTDAFLLAADRDRDAVRADAVERGRAFLDAGATCVFVPGKLDESDLVRLVEALGRQAISVLASPGSPAPSRLAELGVARVSFGPWMQRVAMTALADVGADLLRGNSLPEDVRPLV
jgi:2-methylisocitrate lyase-like PEP mutase family enzyme